MEQHPFWEMLSPLKLFYTSYIEPVCKKYDLTRTELDILLFLAENPSRDTAVEIVQRKYLAKSHVSTSVKILTERGYLEQARDERDRRVTRLIITDKAMAAIRDGQMAQRACQQQIFAGMSNAEIRTISQYFEIMQKNIQERTEELYWKN